MTIQEARALARPGIPAGWRQRYRDADPSLPDGTAFYSTPGHGYLRVDLRRHRAMVSKYDYVDGPTHVLLEEDCSAPLWLAENGVIPFEPYMKRLRSEIERVPAN